jgi:hypothetical protein
MGWGTDFHRIVTTLALLARDLVRMPFSANSNVMDRTKSSRGRRDLTLYINGLPFLQAEAKRQHGQLDDAIQDLRRKHRGFSRLYYPADVEFIFGLAIAGPSYQIYILGPTGLAPLSDVHDITVLADRYYLLRATINMLRWARGMSTGHYFAPPPPPPPPEDDEDGHDVYYVDRILEKGTGRNRGKYLVRWTGYGPKDDTWEPAHRLRDLDAFKAFGADR